MSPVIHTRRVFNTSLISVTVVYRYFGVFVKSDLCAVHSCIMLYMAACTRVRLGLGLGLGECMFSNCVGYYLRFFTIRQVGEIVLVKNGDGIVGFS